MARPHRSLNVWMNGILVGNWSVRQRQSVFQYDPAWLVSPGSRPISLSMPLREKAYQGEVVYNFFDNLLPDTRELRSRLQALYGTASSDAFDLLAEVGRDCVGAVQLLPDSMQPDDLKTIRGTPLTDHELEERLGSVRSPRGQALSGTLRISLAGAQEKLAFLRHQGCWMEPLGSTPTTHIFKLPMGTLDRAFDLTTSVENEWLCHRLLSELGIPVAACEMLAFGSQKALVVERFDRRLSRDETWLMRLPQEDFCQATETSPAQKYETEGGPGIKRCLDLLLASQQPEVDRPDFFRTQVVYWLLCAIDGHAKNFSLFLESGGRFRLTPRYDVLSAYPILGRGPDKLAEQKAEMAMAVWGSSRHYRWLQIQARHWLKTARDCGIPDPESLLHQLASAMPSALERCQRSLPEGFPASVAEPILTGAGKCLARL